MARLLRRLALVLVLLAMALVARTLRIPRAPRGGPPAAPDSSVDANLVAAHLSQAIRFRTVSHQDPGQDDAAELQGLRDFLVRTYPQTHAALTREEIGSHGLLYTWTGAD